MYLTCIGWPQTKGEPMTTLKFAVTIEHTDEKDVIARFQAEGDAYAFWVKKQKAPMFQRPMWCGEAYVLSVRKRGKAIYAT